MLCSLAWGVLVLCCLSRAAAQTDDYDIISSIFSAPSPEDAVSEAEPIEVTDAPDSADACVNAYNNPGRCVHVDLCKLTENTNGRSLINMRSENLCDFYMNVCCALEDIREAPLHPLPVPPGCGTRNPIGVSFSYYGKNVSDRSAQFGEFPWMLALLSERSMADDSRLRVYVCGASLVHPRVALTAAHCVASYTGARPGLWARAGEWDTQHTRDSLTYSEQDVTVRGVTLHERYEADVLNNDIAMVFMETPFTLAAHVGVVCLPEYVDHEHTNKLDNCFSSGWGKDLFGREGIYQVILKKVALHTVGHWRCQRRLRTTRLMKKFVLDVSFMCASGREGADMCDGDGGSPLVCSKNNTSAYELEGIVSWGIGCGRRDLPGVYTNVPYFRKWIDLQLKLNNVDMTPYQRR